MKLPYRKRAILPLEKLTKYVLSETHAVGKLKAKFFRAVGFNETNISLFKKSLLNIAVTEEVKSVAVSLHGKKYIIDGKIKTPKGKAVCIRTVWIIEPGRKKTPRFITTYPL